MNSLSLARLIKTFFLKFGKFSRSRFSVETDVEIQGIFLHTDLIGREANVLRTCNLLFCTRPNCFQMSSSSLGINIYRLYQENYCQTLYKTCNDRNVPSAFRSLPLWTSEMLRRRKGLSIISELKPYCQLSAMFLDVVSPLIEHI